MNDHIELVLEKFTHRNLIPQLDVSICKDREIYQSSFGCAIEHSVDVFEIGSISKTFTTTLLATLHESGVVDINDRVAKYQPDLPFAKDITLKNLATHTSGLATNPVKFSQYSNSKNISKLMEFDKKTYSDFLCSVHSPLKPGKFKYSNIGMALLGNILADCLGKTYEEAVKEKVLLPLGMVDTHISPSSYQLERLAIGHDSKGKPIQNFVWECMEPAGVWRSTTEDMMMFVNAHIGYAGKHSMDALALTTRKAFDKPKLKHIGLGWMLKTNEKLGDMVWHNGGTFGQRSMLLISKEKKTGVILLTNRSPKFPHQLLPKYSLEKLADNILVSLC